jgi:mannosyltransferase
VAAVEARSRTDLLPLALIVAAAAALRFATLDLQSFWYDESVSVSLIREGFSGMLDRIPGSESTPPLYYVLAWIWTRPFGTGEVGLRSLSALLGTACVPVFWLAARELVSRRAALIVAALAAFSPILVWYSQEARAYSLVLFLGALSLLFFARSLRTGQPRDLAAWAAFSALALASHYFALFLVLPEAVWLLARAAERRRAALATALPVAAGLALLPLALHQKSLDLASFIRSDPLLERAARAPKQLLVGFDAPLEVLLAIAAAVIAAAGALTALRRATWGLLLAAALAAATFGIPLLLALVDADYFETRNVLLAWLPAAAVVGAGLAGSRAGIAGAAVLCAIGLAAVIGVDATATWQRDDWRGVAETLGPAPGGRAIVASPAQTSAVPLEVYLPGEVRGLGAGARVHQVAYVSTLGGSGGVHPPEPPRPSVAPGVAGFHELRRVYAAGFTVIVLGAPRPTPVRSAELYPSRLLPLREAALLLQRPG